MPILHILQKCTQYLLVIDEINPSATEVTVALQSFRTRTHHLASEQYHLHIYPPLRLPSPQELVSLPISPSRWWSPWGLWKISCSKGLPLGEILSNHHPNKSQLGILTSHSHDFFFDQLQNPQTHHSSLFAYIPPKIHPSPLLVLVVNRKTGPNSPTLYSDSSLTAFLQ